MTVPIEADILNLRDALWQLEQAAADHLERPTAENRARVAHCLGIAEAARDASHTHEQEREKARRQNWRRLDGGTPEYVTK